MIHSPLFRGFLYSIVLVFLYYLFCVGYFRHQIRDARVIKIKEACLVVQDLETYQVILQGGVSCRFTDRLPTPRDLGLTTVLKPWQYVLKREAGQEGVATVALK